MNVNRKMIVRGCNILLGLAFVLWVVMIGTDYFRTVSQFTTPIFANEMTSEDEQITVYKGIGYEVQMEKRPFEEEMTLASVEFRLFQKPIGNVVID